MSNHLKHHPFDLEEYEGKFGSLWKKTLTNDVDYTGFKLPAPNNLNETLVICVDLLVGWPIISMDTKKKMVTEHMAFLLSYTINTYKAEWWKGHI
jgi:hypothetical protein